MNSQPDTTAQNRIFTPFSLWLSKILRVFQTIPERVDTPELLEQGMGTLDDVRINLREMWRINRWLGGLRALTIHLFPRLRHHPEHITIVDLGSGSGEMVTYLTNWIEQHQLSATVLPLEYEQRHLDVAQGTQKTALDFVQADALALPFAKNRVDYYISSLLLHHLAPEQVITLLRETYTNARHGIIMTDLVRGYLPLLAFALIKPIFARHPFTWHDGKRSIQRAYTPDELRAFAQAAGIKHVRVQTHFPWRMTLVALKSD
jgi:ubiquinone/menaquinone biosynthesis C-methylase UbiE